MNASLRTGGRSASSPNDTTRAHSNGVFGSVCEPRTQRDYDY